MNESLLQVIHAAFPIGVPPDRPLTSHRCEECDETDRLLGGRTWVDVAADFPQYCYDTFPLLTSAAKLYYLPAYMCFEVQSPGYMPGMSVLYALERTEFAPDSFTSDQRSAIWAWIVAYHRIQSDDFSPDSITETW